VFLQQNSYGCLFLFTEHLILISQQDDGT